MTLSKRPMKPADHAVFQSTAEWVRDASARNRLRAVPFAQRQAEADAAYRRALEAGGPPEHRRPAWRRAAGVAARWGETRGGRRASYRHEQTPVDRGAGLLAVMELAVLWVVLPWRYEYLTTDPLQGRCVSLAGWSSPDPFTLTSVPGPQAAIALTAVIVAGRAGRRRAATARCRAVTLRRLAVLVLLSSTAACTGPSGTAQRGRLATEQTAASDCGSEDPFASLVSQPTAQDVTMQQVAPELADPGAFGEAALQVVNNSDVQVGYGVAVILQRWEADAWTNVAQLNTSTGGRPDIFDRCHPAYGTELSLGQEAPARGSGPIETYSLPAFGEDATYRLVRSITTEDGQGLILVLEVASSAADPAPQAS